jgi:hypothetical protein
MKPLRGYERRDPITHRTYDRDVNVKKFEKKGGFPYFINGTGHNVGFEWARRNKVNPKERKEIYSRTNSPSFDEGVHMYKTGLLHALKKKMK